MGFESKVFASGSHKPERRHGAAAGLPRGPRNVRPLLATMAPFAVQADLCAQPLPNDPILFVERSYACSHSLSAETRQAAACDRLERDKADLLNRYRNDPKTLAMIAHPERVKHVGYVGVDRYPAPPK